VGVPKHALTLALPPHAEATLPALIAGPEIGRVALPRTLHRQGPKRKHASGICAGRNLAGLRGDRKGPLFRSAIGKTAQLSGRPILRGDVWRMVRRRAADAGIEAAAGGHTFPRHGDYGLPHERRPHRGRATYGRTLERQDDRAL